MDGILLTRALLDQGLSHNELARLRRRGELERLRRGAYASPTEGELCDFCWKEQRTVGEFDGKIKYGRPIGPGEKPEDAVFREKIREDRIRDLGWEVVRWTWADLEDPRLLVTRLQRAFSRGLRRCT